MTRNKPTLVSFFSGGAGLDLGLEAAGLETLYASDIDHFSCETMKNGAASSVRGGRPFLANAIVEESDISSTRGQDVLDKVDKKRGEIDVMAGGPPCQSFSVFGKRKGVEDPRGQLSDQYVRVLGEIAPKVFVFENVYGLLTIDSGRIFESICEKLRNPSPDLEYKLSVFRLNAENYGVPQKRDRVIIVGSRTGSKLEDIPQITSASDENLLPLRTVRQGLIGLPPEGSERIRNHRGRNHSERIIDRYDNLKPGERDPKTRINRLDLDRPSYTIIVGSDKGGGKGHVHPTQPREVTARESARMQTFPDFWEFEGSVRHPIRQIGNAVPPLLAYSIGRAILKDLLSIEPESFEQAVVHLGQSHLFTKDELSKVALQD
ncbi:DNA cytosine methyltransferase [Glutamicibacter ardleyensis]|uniref:DNA cytosine methyltransferase n=1 Tax=Glutamicibacter ardleyensis TaxID=225894 RepID=UPI003FCF16E5